jgi:hypothetical protein
MVRRGAWCLPGTACLGDAEGGGLRRLGYLALSAFALTLVWLGSYPAQAARLIAAEDFLASPGAQAFRARQYGDALAGFRSLLRQYPDDILILRYIGLALLRQKQYADAIEIMERARALAPDDPAVLFVSGVVRFAAGQRRETASIMRRVRGLAPGSSYARRAARYLQAIGQLDLEQAPKDAPKSWALSLQVGGQFDDNIFAAPGSFSGEKDGFRIFERGAGSYHAVERGPWRLTVDGAAFQSQHPNDVFEEMDLGAYAAGLTLRHAARLEDVPIALSLRYGFDLAVLDGDVFSVIHSLRTSALANWSPYALSEAYHQVDFGDYRDEGFAAGISSRDATLNVLGFKQYLFMENRRHTLWLGYEYRRNDARGVNFEYRGHAVTGGAVVSLPWDVRFDLSAGYASEDYVRFLGFEPRTTDRVTVSVQLSKQLWEGLSVTAAYSRFDENSTIDILAFDRDVATVSLVYGF